MRLATLFFFLAAKLLPRFCSNEPVLFCAWPPDAKASDHMVFIGIALSIEKIYRADADELRRNVRDLAAGSAGGKRGETSH